MSGHKISDGIWKSDGYNKTNCAQFRDAQEMINDVIKAIETTCQDIIVDIGCGSGNVTDAFANQIPHRKIYATDIDSKMINFASKNYARESIVWLQQDIGLPWTDLHADLRDLEGQVSIVWCNRVIHWVKDKPTAVDNISRLLKPGGKCFFNISLCKNLKDHLTQEQVQEVKENFSTLSLSEEDDLAMWKDVFHNSTLSSVDMKIVQRQWTFEDPNDYKFILAGMPFFMRSKLTPGIPEDKSDEMVRKYSDMYIRLFSICKGQSLPESLPTVSKIVNYYPQLNVIGTK